LIRKEQDKLTCLKHEIANKLILRKRGRKVIPYSADALEYHSSGEWRYVSGPSNLFIPDEGELVVCHDGTVPSVATGLKNKILYKTGQR